MPPINALKMTKETLTWVAPSVGIPSLRYFQDSKEQRRELFIRDAATYSLGAVTYLVLFYGGKRAMGHFFPKMKEELKEFIPFLVALAANITYSGIGAVRLSKYLSGKTAKPEAPPGQPFPQAAWPPFTPISSNATPNTSSNRIYLQA